MTSTDKLTKQAKFVPKIGHKNNFQQKERKNSHKFNVYTIHKVLMVLTVPSNVSASLQVTAFYNFKAWGPTTLRADLREFL